MREHEARLADPLAGRVHFRGIEQLEPRLLLSVAPTLPGLQIVDPDNTRLDGQVVVLDFHGAEDVDYHGPVEVSDIDVPAFKAPGGIAGQEEAIIGRLTGELNSLFASAGVTFVTEVPQDVAAYSTIFVGGNDSPFAAFGSFLGVAEQVDIGNQNSSDNAFVFSDILGEPDGGLDEYVSNLGDVIAHEAGRLLGYADSNPREGTGPLASLSATYYSAYGSSRTHNITVNAGSHNFQVDGIAANKNTEWYVNGNYTGSGQNDWSGTFAIDPEYTYSFSSSTTQIKALVYDRYWNYEEYHTWNVSVAKPDLIVQDISISPSSPTAGQSATITATLKNQGNADASGSIRLMYYVAGSYIGDDYLSFGLGAGSSNEESISYTASSSGNKTVQVIVDTENIVSESNESNNSRSETYYWNPPPQPDLIVQDISISPSSPIAGQSATITATLKNQGNANASGSIRLNYYIDGGYIGYDDMSFGLGAGSTDTESISYTVSSSGNHTVRVLVDSNGTVSESNESNNDRSETYYWNPPPQPDLIVYSVTGPGSAYNIGQTIYATATIKNQDQGTASGSNLYYYLGTADGSNKTYRSIEQGSVGSLAYNATESDQINFGWTIPGDVAEGSYRIWVLADSSGTVTESNEGNNWGSSGSFTVSVPKPDLIAQDIKIEGQTDLSTVTIYAGSTVTLDALSRNVGTASSNSSVPYRWWWGYSSNDRFQQITDGSGNDIGGTIAEVNGLQVDEDEWISEVVIGGIDPDNWVVNLPAGTYWLTFEIDSPSANQELNEGNNWRSEQFVVTSPNRDPSDPTNIHTVSVTQSTATIAWNPSSDADGDPITYKIQYGKDWSWDGWNPSTPLSTTANSIMIAGLEEGRTYDVKIWADDGRGGTSTEVVIDKLFTTAQFVPSFDDVRIVNGVDNDGDGYMQQFGLSFDVDSNLPGNYYVEIWEDDPSIFGWGDDYIDTTPILTVSGNDDVYYTYTVITDEHDLGLGTAEFVLKLYNAATDDLVQTCHKGDDSALGNVNVEFEYQDSTQATIIQHFAQALDNIVDLGPGEAHPLLNFGMSFDIDPLVKAIGRSAILAPPVAAALETIGWALDLANTQVHFGAFLDLADLLVDSSGNPWTQDGADEYVTIFLTAGASLVNTSSRVTDILTDPDIEANFSLVTAGCDTAAESYYGEPNLGSATFAEFSSTNGPVKTSVGVGLDGVDLSGEIELLPTNWTFEKGVTLLSFEFPFLSFDLHQSVLRTITDSTAFKPLFSTMFDILAGAGINLTLDQPTDYTFADILFDKESGGSTPSLWRSAWPATSGVLKDFAGGIDATGEGIGDGYYPVFPTGQTPTGAYPYLTGLDIKNTGGEEDDFFVEVKDVAPNWFLEADDGWPSDRKYDVTNIPAGAEAATRWVIAPYEGAADTTFRFNLYHDRFGFWANEYLTTLEVPAYVGSPVISSPEIDVERGGTDNVHSHAFGQVTLGQSASQVFTVRNEGDAPLTVSQASGLSGPFSINLVNGSGTGDDWVVDAGSTRQFTVTYQPTASGGHNATLTLANNDDDEGSYQISFSGTGVATAEIEVKQNTTLIADNSSVFDFGSVLEGSGGREFIFTINNLGDLNLTVGSVLLDNNNGFQVTQQPSGNVAGSGSTAFWIKMLADTPGTKSADVRFSNGDANGDENPFNFHIEGSVTDVLDAQVAGQYVFYNNSPMDGNTSGASSQEDNAIAVGKQALMPGDTGSGANCTAYSKGLNGIMVDIDGLANPGGLTLATIGNYFGFKVGTSGDPSGWASAPAPTVVDVRSVGGNSRVTIIWADNAIQKQWLQVTVKSGAATGLPDDEVFYFGNMPGDATGDGVTNGFDLLRVRQNYLLPPGGGRDDTADVTMDGNVNAFDLLAVRQNYLQSLPMISTPAAPTGMAMAMSSFEEPIESLAIQPVALHAAPVVEQLQVTVAPTATISASFNRPVSVALAALEMVNPIGLKLELPTFRYEPVTRTASWTRTGLADGLYQGVIRSSGVLSDGFTMARDSQFRFRLTGGIISEFQQDRNGDGISAARLGPQG